VGAFVNAMALLSDVIDIHNSGEQTGHRVCDDGPERSRLIVRIGKYS
jgi:hypothetical protein